MSPMMWGKCSFDQFRLFKAVNNHLSNQSGHDTRIWYHKTAAIKECPQAPFLSFSPPYRAIFLFALYPTWEPVHRLRFTESALYVGWICCWFSSLLREVFRRVPWFSRLLKKQHFQMNSTWNLRATGLSVVTDCQVSRKLNILADFRYWALSKGTFITPHQTF